MLSQKMLFLGDTFSLHTTKQCQNQNSCWWFTEIRSLRDVYTRPSLTTAFQLFCPIILYRTDFHLLICYLGRKWYFLYLVVILGIVSTSPSQVYYVNIALKYDKASKITPVKYAGTNILIVIGSILLFNEWVVLDAGDTFGMTCGLLIAVCGIRLVVQE